MLGLMDRFGQGPEVVLSWDASLLRLLHIERIELARIARERQDTHDI